MKHETFKIEPLLDLGKPSLEALSHILRHRDLWPKGFVWDYRSCHQCAMGLTYDLWNRSRREYVHTIFDMPWGAASAIFGRIGADRGIPAKDVTPEMVAEAIDDYRRAE